MDVTFGIANGNGPLHVLNAAGTASLCGSARAASTKCVANSRLPERLCAKCALIYGWQALTGSPPPEVPQRLSVSRVGHGPGAA